MLYWRFKGGLISAVESLSITVNLFDGFPYYHLRYGHCQPIPPILSVVVWKLNAREIKFRIEDFLVLSDFVTRKKFDSIPAKGLLYRWRKTRRTCRPVETIGTMLKRRKFDVLVYSVESPHHLRFVYKRNYFLIRLVMVTTWYIERDPFSPENENHMASSATVWRTFSNILGRRI